MSNDLRPKMERNEIDEAPPLNRALPDVITSLAKVIDDSGDGSSYVRAICHFCGASAGLYWSNQGTTFSRDLFVLKGVYNRPALNQKINKSNLDISESFVVAANAIRTKQPIFGAYGEPPFDSNWISLKYNQELSSLNPLAVAVVPLFGKDQSAIGFLSLYFSGYSSQLAYSFNSLGEFASSLSESIATYAKLRLSRRKDRHEILTHSAIIERKLLELRSLSISGSDKDSDTRRLLSKKFDDALRSLKVLRSSYDKTDFHDRVDDRRDHSTPISLKPFAEDVLTATYHALQNKRIERGPIIGRNFSIKFNSEDLTVLINNLYVNAFKYASGGAVTTEMDVINNVGVFTVRNEISNNQVENLNEIWKYEIRGRSAIESDIPGEGLGLGLVNDICDVYDVDSRAYYESKDEKSSIRMFVVRLEFSRPTLMG